MLGQLGQKIADFFGENSELDPMAFTSQGHSELLDPDYLSELLPYRLYDAEKKIYENKTSFGFVIEAVPLLGSSLEAQRELSALVREIGEEGAEIQCLVFADPRIDGFLHRWEEPRQNEGGIFAKLAEKRREFLESRSLKMEAPLRIFRFFFSYSQPKPPRKEIPQFLLQLAEKKEKALGTFSRLSQASEMEPSSLIDLLSGMVNFELSSTSGQKKWDRNRWLSQQICEPGTALEIRKDGLLFHGSRGNSFLRTYEASEAPDQWNLALSGELIGDFFNASYRIPSPFYLHYGIHFPSQEKMGMRFKAKKKILEHQSKFPYMARMCPTLPREMEESLYVQTQLLEGEKFIETRLSAGLWADPKNFASAESTLKALFLKYGFPLKENHFIHFPDFLSSLPMAWAEDSPYISGLKRARCMRTTLTEETAHLIPCVGEWRGNCKEGNLLVGRRGQIAAWDPFAVDGNLNSVIVGPSGSGKSVFMQEMIMSHLAQGGRVFVLDLGRSFEKLCHLLGGQYIDFSEKSRFDLNPFHLIPIDCDAEALNAGLDMVASIVATMAMPSQKIDKERADLLASVVKTAWEKEGRASTIDTVIALIDDLKFQSELMIGASESLKEGLKKYGRQGVYANYFYGMNSVDFSADLVVIETEELKNMADLQSVILQIFTLTISNQIFLGDRKRRSIVCFDEAWDLLKSPQMEGFIESLARRLRKYNGALVVGTQSIKDFERSFGAKAAFQNSNWLVLLGKDSDSIHALKKENLIPMDEFRESALSSLKMEAGKYSEVCIYHKGTGSFVIAQLRLDPFSSLLYSTKPEEYKDVQELKRQGLTIEEALERLLREKK